jgi:hypothetical protein
MDMHARVIPSSPPPSYTVLLHFDEEKKKATPEKNASRAAWSIQVHKVFFSFPPFSFTHVCFALSFLPCSYSCRYAFYPLFLDFEFSHESMKV